MEVTVVDINPDRIAAWRSDTLPIYEPGLHEAVQAARDGILPGHLFGGQDRDGALHSGHAFRTPSLFFSTDVDQAIMNADLIFVCVNTPTKSHGIGKGSAADVGFVEAATRNIARVAKNDKIVVEKSTVPCRTAQSIREIVSTTSQSLDTAVLRLHLAGSERPSRRPLRRPFQPRIPGRGHSYPRPTVP